MEPGLYTDGHYGEIDYMQTPLQERLRELEACTQARKFFGSCTLAQAVEKLLNCQYEQEHYRWKRYCGYADWALGEVFGEHTEEFDSEEVWTRLGQEDAHRVVRRHAHGAY